MTLAELQELIAKTKGEWEHIEFKKSTGELHGGMETLCGFLNGNGGKVFFGVTNAGRIQGQDLADSTFQEVANAIRKIEPPAWIEQTRVPIDARKEVLILESTQHSNGPYTFDGRPYLRIGNTTSRMPQPEYDRRLHARSFSTHRWENEAAEGYSLAHDMVWAAWRLSVAEFVRIPVKLSSESEFSRIPLRKTASRPNQVVRPVFAGRLRLACD